MLKRFPLLAAIATMTLLGACAMPPCCKSSPDNPGCCGAVPCRGMAMKGEGEGMGCDPEMREKTMMKKHHGHHHGHHRMKPAEAAPVPATPAAAAVPAPEPAKGGSNVIEGVKKIIKDVHKPEDTKKPE